ncbi:hypothetical protein [Synechococcus sp.]|uniref:hypothetical protein n=1 Tax=Synechococcus sp. TaxID=1131 RepID=UPI0034A36A05
MPLARETLDEVLRAVTGARRDKVSEWLREGALQPLRRGLYLTGAPLRSRMVCLPLVANHLYGPSCVSLDFALALAWADPRGGGRSDVGDAQGPAAGSATRWGGSVTTTCPSHYYAVGQELGAVAAMGSAF